MAGAEGAAHVHVQWLRLHTVPRKAEFGEFPIGEMPICGVEFRGREGAFFNDKFKCPMCGASKATTS